MWSKIVGTGSYLPKNVLTNAELVDGLGVDEQWIVDKTGIKERRIAESHEATSDLATIAAQRALRSAGVEAQDIDLIVLATANPDQPIPATACFVQANIGATRAVSFDVMAACAGFVFALSVADDMMRGNENVQTALVIGSDMYSRSVDYTDRKTCVLLGDGAGAVILRKTSEQSGILAKRLFSDGKLAHLAHIPAGGTRQPSSEETLAGRQHFLKMEGREIRNIVDDILPQLIYDLVGAAHVDFSNVSLIVPHQMNGAMLRTWSQILDVEPHVIHQTVAWSGNTGAASVPIALDDAVHTGAISEDRIVLLVAFGAGLTWGGLLMKWS